MNQEKEIKIFSLMAGIEEPWLLEKVELDETKEVDVKIRALLTEKEYKKLTRKMAVVGIKCFFARMRIARRINASK